jgi:hypothetical protein
MADDDAAMIDADEQRAHPRTGFGLQVSLMLLREKQPIAATLENISEGGCYFATRAPVKEGAAVSVVFGLRPKGPLRRLGPGGAGRGRRGLRREVQRHQLPTCASS